MTSHHTAEVAKLKAEYADLSDADCIAETGRDREGVMALLSEIEAKIAACPAAAANYLLDGNRLVVAMAQAAMGASKADIARDQGLTTLIFAERHGLI